MYEHRANFHLLVELLLHVTKIKYNMYNVQDYSVLCNKAVRPGYEWGLAFYSHVENTHERIISLIGDVYVLITSLTPSLFSYCHHWASVVCRPSSVRPLTFHILINSSEATGPIWTKLWWNGPWIAPFQIYVRSSRLPTKMATKLKIEKRGMKLSIAALV